MYGLECIAYLSVSRSLTKFQRNIYRFVWTGKLGDLPSGGVLVPPRAKSPAHDLANQYENILNKLCSCFKFKILKQLFHYVKNCNSQ